jgi:hypothetical protein
MRRRWWRGLRFAGVAVLAAAVCTLVTMSLWNWLAPALFGWHEISFGQALGLLVLSRILFGGYRGGGGYRRRLRDRWEQMSPEEREKFRQGMRGRCGEFGRPAPDVQG